MRDLHAYSALVLLVILLVILLVERIRNHPENIVREDAWDSHASKDSHATLESMSTVSTVGGPLYSEYSDKYSEYSVSTVSGTQWCHCVPLSERYTDCALCNTVHSY